MKWLIGVGATQDGRTPLFIAAWNGEAALAQVLLGVGANKEAQDKVRERRGGDRR